MQPIRITNQITGEDIFEALTPQAQEVVEIAIAGGAFPDDPVEKRHAFDRLFAKLSGEPAAVHRVEDLTISSGGEPITLRVYHPAEGRLPAIVYFHGGGFNKGSLTSHDVALRALTNKTGCIVIAVDYHLTPEHHYPTQINEAFDALQWVAEHTDQLGIDPAKIGVGGDSVGGNLAAVTALRARDEGAPQVAFQILFYPVTDVTLSTQSWREMAEGPWLTKAGENEGFSSFYLPPGTDPALPYISPLHAPDLSNLPPALVIDAQFDPYRDEGQLYAQRLQEAGIAVVTAVYPGVIHDFILMGGRLPDTQRAFEQAADFIKGLWQ